LEKKDVQTKPLLRNSATTGAAFKGKLSTLHGKKGVTRD